MLCDAAQEVGGKLYILGGGWSVLNTPNVPTQMAVAVKMSVPWDQTNERHQLRIQLMDADGQPVDLGEGPIHVAGDFEVGRPPGMKRGMPIDTPLVAGFILALAPGQYVWELEIDGTQMARAPFSVRD